MTAADPYTDTIPGFIPDAALTREWAREAFGERLTAFAQALADQSVEANEMVEAGEAA